MKRDLLLLTISLVVFPAWADVYKCTSSDGGTTYSQTPCAKDAVVLKTSSDIIGAWIWKQDKIVFSKEGRGSYLRAGTVCYEFSYEYRPPKLKILADRPHACGVGVEQDYLTVMNTRALGLKHVGTGFLTLWQYAN